MKTFVLVLAIGLFPFVLFAQTESGIEPGTPVEETFVQTTPGSVQPPSDASLVLHVIPPAYASIGGGVTFTGPLANTQRTYQMLIHDTLLTALVGKQIAAFSWRLPTSATAAWPTAGVTYANYDVYLSGSVPPANRSLTFAQNVVGVQTRVRFDSLAIATGSYVFGGNPNEWGPEITFTPWLYTGGHLLIEIRQNGFTGTSRSVDAISTSASGYGNEFSACWVGSYTGTTGSQGNFSIVRLRADSLLVSVGEDGRDAPRTFALHQNYPNPFNPVTHIRYSLPARQAGFVSLKIYDVLGREVATLVNEERPAGTHSVTFDATGLASGVYMYRLTTGSFTDMKQMVLVR